MNKKNDEERKCIFCGKTLVGKNKIAICSACRKKAGDTGVKILGFLGVVATAISGIKMFDKDN